MFRFYILAIILFLSIASYAQSVTVKRESEKVKGENADGAGAELNGKKTEVASSWGKFLKEIGKIKLFSSDPVVITSPLFNGTTYPDGIIYANLYDNGNTVRVWLGVKPSEWAAKDGDYLQKQLEKLIYQFGIRFYREQEQLGIDEAIQATDAVDKQSQRLVNQNKDLTTKLANNEQQRVQLEKSLESNKLENAALKIKIENNKKAQDSIANASISIKKALEIHQEKLKKIN